MNKTLVGNEANLVGYWKFDETSGTTAADSVTTAGHTAHPGTLMATHRQPADLRRLDRADQLPVNPRKSGADGTTVGTQCAIVTVFT